MRDFLPADKARREQALATIRRVYAEHGFDEIETPALEDTDRLHAGLGGDNEKLAFAVLRRGLGPDDLAVAARSGDPLALADLGLRFDLTVPLARYVASNRGQLPSVFRAVQIGPVWRAERPQQGRFRQFLQCDIDIIGEPGLLAEAELITATVSALDALGLTGTSVRINDRRILQGILHAWGIATKQQYRALITLDKLDKIGVAGVANEFVALGMTATDVSADLAALAAADWTLGATPPPWLDIAAFGGLRRLRETIPGATLRFDPTLVRGMGYYTGTIFEIAHPELGYSLGGGGRYDGMIGRFLGQDVPACGFSLGFERLVDLLPPPAATARRVVALVYGADIPMETVLTHKRALLGQGLTVRLEPDAKNQRALFGRLAAASCTEVAFLCGPEPEPAPLTPRPLRV